MSFPKFNSVDCFTVNFKHFHGTELEHLKEFAALANSIRFVKDRPFRIKLDENGNDDPDRDETNGENEGANNIDQSFDEVVKHKLILF